MKQYRVILEKVLTYTAEVTVIASGADLLEGTQGLDALRRGLNVAQGPGVHWELTGESLEAMQALDPEQYPE